MATSGNHAWLQSQKLLVLQVGVAETSIFDEQRFVFPIVVPVIVSLQMSLSLLERIIQVTIEPSQLRDAAQIVRHLCHLAWNVFVVGPQRIQSFVSIRVDNGVSEVPMGLALLVKVLRHVRVIKAENHIFIIIYLITN